MAVHPGAVVAEERLRHERRGLPRRVGDVLDHVLVGHDLIGHAQQRLEAEVDLALAARGDLVVVELARDAELLERQHHAGAEVVERVVRRRREVPLLLAHGVAEPGLARVPVALRRVDRVVRLVVCDLVADRVEHEELALGADVARVGDVGRAQVLLRALGYAARILRVRLVRDRVDDLADERQRRRLGERIEDRARRIRHEQHVRLGDALPAADGRAVEPEPLVEARFVEGRERQRHVLPRAEQVAELEVDHRRLRLTRPLERLGGSGLLRAPVRQVVLGLFLHLSSSLKCGRPQSRKALRPHCLRADLPGPREIDPNAAGGRKRPERTCLQEPEALAPHLTAGPDRAR